MKRIQLSVAGGALLVLVCTSACSSGHVAADAPSTAASSPAQSATTASAGGSPSAAPIPADLSFVFDTGAYLQDRDGSNLSVIPGTVGCFAGTWFPDDARIVINCGLGTSPPWHVRVASVTGVVGGGFDNPLPGSQPFLSADGSSLAYADGTNIYVTDLNGKANHTIAGAQGFLGFLAWSPDGKQLVFTSTTGTDTQLLTVSPGGGTPTPMLSSFDPMGHTSFEAYSPDGGQILLSGSGDQTDDIRIVNADGTGLYTVTGAGEGSDAVWLP